MDPSAIDLDYGTGWTHVDYIASELCEYLHPLIATGDILEGPVPVLRDGGMRLKLKWEAGFYSISGSGINKNTMAICGK